MVHVNPKDEFSPKYCRQHLTQYKDRMVDSLSERATDERPMGREFLEMLYERNWFWEETKAEV
jgi:hypothetical protein